MQHPTMSRLPEVTIPVSVVLVGALVTDAAAGVWALTIFMFVAGLFAFPALAVGFVVTRVIGAFGRSWSRAAQVSMLCGAWVLSGAAAFGLAWVGTEHGPSWS